MRFAAFSISGERRVGMVSTDGANFHPINMSTERAAKGVAALIGMSDAEIADVSSPIRAHEVTLEAPFPRPGRNIFCVGKNYLDHAHEFSNSGFDSSAAASTVPKAPIIFSKVPETVIAHGEKIIIDPTVSAAIDYEAELAVIIGTGGRSISKADAMNHVWGFTLVNDVTARDLQGKYSQWLIGKSQDTFCPMGPFAVTRDELDIGDTEIRCVVNGEIRQQANTRDLIFDVPTIIETLSAGITLLPGDIIATGTPAGVGIGFDPPRYLRHGDVVRVEIDVIGSLENQCEERPS